MVSAYHANIKTGGVVLLHLFFHDALKSYCVSLRNNLSIGTTFRNCVHCVIKLIPQLSLCRNTCAQYLCLSQPANGMARLIPLKVFPAPLAA